jgi:phosphoribosylaminoimidazole-succinocarboxamide synthase|tara:strand:+ start:3537 stop:4451 length:915 start_codon:yes stop_codon:yes gene_type:complete
MNLAELRSRLPETALLELPELPFRHLASGKVREIFEVDRETLLIIATDRLSAFDVVLPDGIPGKGVILTQFSLHWFGEITKIVPNHLVPDHDLKLAALLKDFPAFIARSMLVRKMKPLPLEAVVRGYLSGSGWKHYLAHGNLFGQELPQGLGESAKLPLPLFTPTTKAAVGDHDMPVTVPEGGALVGEAVFAQTREISLELYALGNAAAKNAGLILADTKFEFGFDIDGTLCLIDEVLTPDSSRFWPAPVYEPGKTQPAFDKQYVRDFLETLDWDKTAPGPSLPAHVIDNTRELYLKAFGKIVG